RADRYLYVAALGIFWALSRAIERYRIAGVVAAAALLGLMWLRIPAWQDAKSLWSDCVAKQPNSIVGHFSLAGCHVRDHNWPAAEAELRKTLELREGF